MSDKGVSPVIGIILLTAVTVALVSLAAFFVFDIGQSSNSGVGTATVSSEYISDSRIDVQLVKQQSADRVIVRSSLGTEYVLDSAGESVTLLNQDGNKTPVVLSEKNGEQTVLRDVPPQSFTPDIVVSDQKNIGQYSSVKKALNSAQDGDIIVLKKGVYYENIDISTPNVTLVGESGTVVADNTSDNAVIDVLADGVRVSNIDVNAGSNQSATSAEYGIDAGFSAELSKVSVRNARTSDYTGSVNQVSSSEFVSPAQIGVDSSSGSTQMTPVIEWSTEYNSTNGGDIAESVAVDSNGNVIVAGAGKDGSGNSVFRVAKYDSNGNTVWVRTLSSQIGYAEDVAVDSQNNVLVGGSVDGTNYKDWIVVKYNSSGGVIWSEKYRTSVDNKVLGVTVDNNDNVVAVGHTRPTSSDDKDWQVIKYSSSGVVQWNDTYDSGIGAYESAGDADITSNNNIVVVGGTRNPDSDWRTVKYTSSGTEKWSTVYDSGFGNDYPSDISVDGEDNIVTHGVRENSAGNYYAHIVKYTNSGTELWNQSYSDVGRSYGFGLAVNKNNNIVVSGRQLTGGQNYNWFVAKYNSSGVREWNTTYDGGTGNIDFARGVAIDEVGDFIVVGRVEAGDGYDWRVAKYVE